MVYQKQANEENGIYVDQEGHHYDILSCNVTESKEWYETGEVTIEHDENGNEIEVPVIASRIVINKNWDSFDSLEAAAEAYGLTIDKKREAGDFSESVIDLPEVHESI